MEMPGPWSITFGGVGRAQVDGTALFEHGFSPTSPAEGTATYPISLRHGEERTRIVERYREKEEADKKENMKR